MILKFHALDRLVGFNVSSENDTISLAQIEESPSLELNLGNEVILVDVGENFTTIVTSQFIRIL
jgi:hypothetical protein